MSTDQKLMGSNIWDQPTGKQEEDKSNKSSFSQSLPSERLPLCLTYIFCLLKRSAKPKKLLIQINSNIEVQMKQQLLLGMATIVVMGETKSDF